jgi:integrase
LGIWKDKKTKEWIYKFKYRGKSYGGRGAKTRREAITAREKRRKEVQVSLKQTPADIGFKEAASAYLDYSERKHAQQTYQYKALTYREFIKMHGDPVITSANMPILILEYLNSMTSNAVYNARRKDLSALFEWLKNTYGIPAENPCAKIDKMPHAPKDKQVPTVEEVMKLIMAATPGDEQDIIMCCLHLMARIDEVLRLDWQRDINFEARTVTLRTRKRKGGVYEPDDMPMDEDLYRILYRRYRKNRKNDKWVFYNAKTGDRYYHRPKMMASLCKRAGIKPLDQSKRKIQRGKNKGKYETVNLYYGFHALRHFVPSHLMDKKKVSLKTLQKLLRHRSAKTTELYVHSVDESVRAAMTEIEGEFTPILVKVPQKAPHSF